MKGDFCECRWCVYVCLTGQVTLECHHSLRLNNLFQKWKIQTYFFSCVFKNNNSDWLMILLVLLNSWPNYYLVILSNTVQVTGLGVTVPISAIPDDTGVTVITRQFHNLLVWKKKKKEERTEGGREGEMKKGRKEGRTGGWLPSLCSQSSLSSYPDGLVG